MKVRGWLIVGGRNGLPPEAYVGDYIGALPDAANFKVGQWLYWRPVTALVAETSTQMPVVCIEVPL